MGILTNQPGRGGYAQPMEEITKKINLEIANQEWEIERMNQEKAIAPRSHAGMIREKIIVASAKIQAYQKVLTFLGNELD